MIKLKDSTKIAIQASVAVAVAIIISELFKLERSYWAIVTSLVLISQTWGQSIKKAVERVSMTILGGILGTLLFILFRENHEWQFVMILISVFFTVYFLGYSYYLSVFFATIFVVFLFSLTHPWNLHILQDRIFETMIGAVIAVVTSTYVFPITERGGLKTHFVEFIDKTTKFIDSIFSVISGKKEDHVSFKDRRESFMAYVNLKKMIATISYELFFTFYSRHVLKNIVINLGALRHYVTSMVDLAPDINSSKTLPVIEEEIKEAHLILSSNMQYIRSLFLEKKPEFEFRLLDPVLEKAQIKIAQSLQEKNQDQSTWFDSFSFFYFMEKTNEILNNIKKLIE